MRRFDRIDRGIPAILAPSIRRVIRRAIQQEGSRVISAL
jgi:hypothetical protein